MDLAAAARYVRISGADREAFEALGGGSPSSLTGSSGGGGGGGVYMGVARLERELLGAREAERSERLAELRLRRNQVLLSESPSQEELIALQVEEEEHHAAILREVEEKERIRKEIAGLERDLLHARVREAHQELQALENEQRALAEREKEKLRALQEAQESIIAQDREREEALRRHARGPADFELRKSTQAQRQKILSQRVALAEDYGVKLEGFRKEREWIEKESATLNSAKKGMGNVEVPVSGTPERLASGGGLDILTPSGLEKADRELRKRREVLLDNEKAMLKEASKFGVVLGQVPAHIFELHDDGDQVRPTSEDKTEGVIAVKDRVSQVVVSPESTEIATAGDPQTTPTIAPSAPKYGTEKSMQSAVVVPENEQLTNVVRELAEEVRKLKLIGATDKEQEGDKSQTQPIVGDASSRNPWPMRTPRKNSNRLAMPPTSEETNLQIAALEADTARLQRELYLINAGMIPHAHSATLMTSQSTGGLGSEILQSWGSSGHFSNPVQDSSAAGLVLRPEQAEKLAELDFEMKRLEMEARLEQMRDTMAQQRAMKESKAKHALELEEKKRDMELLQTRRAIAQDRREEYGTAAALATATSLAQPHEVLEGFSVWWDALIGDLRSISSKASLYVRILFGVYNGATLVGSMMSTTFHPLFQDDSFEIHDPRADRRSQDEWDDHALRDPLLCHSGGPAPSGGCRILPWNSHISGTPLSSSHRIVFELQAKQRDRQGDRKRGGGDHVTVGWGAIPLFGPYSDPPFVTLRAGFWAIPVWAGKANLNPVAAHQASSCRGELKICVRLSHHRDKPLAGAFFPEPGALHLYKPSKKAAPLSLTSAFMVCFAVSRLQARRKRHLLEARVKRRNLSTNRRVSLEVRRRSGPTSTSTLRETISRQPAPLSPDRVTVKSSSSEGGDSGVDDDAQSVDANSDATFSGTSTHRKTLNSIISATSIAYSFGSTSAANTKSRLRDLSEKAKKKPAPFGETDGVIIGIDGAYGVPYGSSITKITVRAFGGHNMSPLIPPGEVCAISAPTSVWHSPKYNEKCVLSGGRLPRDALLLFRMDTVDKEGLCAIGYSVVGLFTNESGEPLTETGGGKTVGEYFLREGALELPFSRVPPSDMSKLGHGCLCNLPRVACLRLRIQVKSFPGSSGPDTSTLACPPALNDSEYDALSLAPPQSGKEAKLLRIIRDEEPQTCIEVAQARLDFKDQGSDYYLKKASELFAGKPRRMMSFDSAPYSHEDGFMVKIDGLAGMRGGGGAFGGTSVLFKPLYSLLVPGLFYGNPPMLDQAKYPRLYNLSSGVNAPTFADEFSAFQHSRYDLAQCVVIDVRQLPVASLTPTSVSPKPSLQTKVGWGILPVFRADKTINVGAHQVPLFAGSFPSELLGSEEPLKTLSQWVSDKKIKILTSSSGPASAVVTLGHPLLEPPGNPLSDPKAELKQALVSSAAAAAGIPQHRWESALEGGDSGKPIFKAIPKKVSREDFNDIVNSAFEKASGMSSAAVPSPEARAKP